MPSLERNAVLPEPDLTPGTECLAAGRTLAKTWTLGPSAFLAEADVASEADYKRREMAAGRIMRHAQIGYRDAEKSRRAYGEIHERVTAAISRRL